VTGARSGIGEGSAQALAGAGAGVACTDLDGRGLTFRAIPDRLIALRERVRAEEGVPAGGGAPPGARVVLAKPPSRSERDRGQSAAKAFALVE